METQIRRRITRNLTLELQQRKIWDMIRKITGKNRNNKHVHIKLNGNICSTTKDISNALGENFQKNSSSANYSENFQNIKQEREKEHLNFM